MGRVLFSVGVALSAACVTHDANAGAWLAPADGQRIVTAAAGERDGFAVFESSTYIEAPLNDSFSILATPWIETSYDLPEGWRAETTLGVKYAVFRRERSVMAVQAGAYWRSDPPEGCGEGGAEVRWLGGQSFGETGFINLDLGTRLLDGGCGGERMELSAGFEPVENWMTLGQVFLDAPHEGEETVKFQLSLVRFSAAGRGIQVGVRTRLDEPGAETALVLGLWGGAGGD